MKPFKVIITVAPVGVVPNANNQVVVGKDDHGRAVIKAFKPNDFTADTLDLFGDEDVAYEEFANGLWTIHFSRSLTDLLEELRVHCRFDLREPEEVKDERAQAPKVQGRFAMAAFAGD